MGVAVVGAGRIGGLRARLAAEHPAVKFMAVSDVEPARARDLAKKTGAQFHSGDNAAVISRPEVNAVVVSSSEGAHVEPLLQAIELGKPVTVPLAAFKFAHGGPSIERPPARVGEHTDTVLASVGYSAAEIAALRAAGAAG